jgi:hypothetical protein
MIHRHIMRVRGIRPDPSKGENQGGVDMTALMVSSRQNSNSRTYRAGEKYHRDEMASSEHVKSTSF